MKIWIVFPESATEKRDCINAAHTADTVNA